MRGVWQLVSKQVLQSGLPAPVQLLLHMSVAHELIPSSRFATPADAAATQAQRQAAPPPLLLQLAWHISVALQVTVPPGTPPPAAQLVPADAWK